MSDTLNELIGRIYELGLDAETWPRLLDEIALFYKCDVAAYVQRDALDSWRSLSAFRHPEPDSPVVIDSMQNYEGLPPDADIWFKAFRKSAHSGAGVILGHAIVNHDEFLRSDHYNQVIKPLGGFDVMTMPLQNSNSDWDFFCLYTDGPDRLFTGREAATFGAIKPHVRRVLGLQRRFQNDLQLARLSASALDALSFPLFLLGANGKILLANVQAQSLLVRRDGLLERGGAVTMVHPEERACLKHLLERACGIGGRPMGGSLSIKRAGASAPLALHVYPFEASDRPSTLSPLTQERCALIVVSDPSERPPTNAAIWTALYGFTATETKIGERMLEGRRQQEIAAGLQITVNTMRWHVKSMLRKTETTREANLVLQLVRHLPPINAKHYGDVTK